MISILRRKHQTIPPRFKKLQLIKTSRANGTGRFNTGRKNAANKSRQFLFDKCVMDGCNSLIRIFFVN